MDFSCEGQEERRVVFCGIGHLQGWGDVTIDNIDGFYWWLWKPSQVGDVWLWGNCWLKHQVTRKDQTWCHCHHCHNHHNDHCYNHHKNHIIIMIIATLQAVLSSNKHRRSKGWVAGREQCDHQSLTTEVPFHHPALYLAVCVIIPVTRVSDVMGGRL